jgi:ElaB/YqjD/DUF883 family membrane-anchored ribosome-binding protein
MRDLVEDARVLMDATANVAGDKVAKARKRLAAALERGKSEGEALMGSSADLVEETVGELHKVLSAALDHGMEMYGDLRDKALDKAKAADEIVRENPYRAIGIALGVGALVGYFTSFRHCRKED